MDFRSVGWPCVGFLPSGKTDVNQKVSSDCIDMSVSIKLANVVPPLTMGTIIVSLCHWKYLLLLLLLYFFFN